MRDARQRPLSWMAPERQANRLLNKPIGKQREPHDGLLRVEQKPAWICSSLLTNRRALPLLRPSRVIALLAAPSRYDRNGQYCSRNSKLV